MSDKYIELHQLGKGSYGTVFRAAAAKVGGPCAVKILPWGPADVTADMKRELKLMQRRLNLLLFNTVLAHRVKAGQDQLLNVFR